MNLLAVRGNLWLHNKFKARVYEILSGKKERGGGREGGKGTEEGREIKRREIRRRESEEERE